MIIFQVFFTYLRNFENFFLTYYSLCKLCRENSIKYECSYGSMLGAVSFFLLFSIFTLSLSVSNAVYGQFVLVFVEYNKNSLYIMNDVYFLFHVRINGMSELHTSWINSTWFNNQNSPFSILPWKLLYIYYLYFTLFTIFLSFSL